MATRKRYSDVVELSRDILGDDDPDFAEELQKQIESRRLVRLLSTLRNKKGINQEEVAAVMGCRQAKISKLENGTDEAVSIGEIEAYAKAIDCDVELVIRNRNSTLVDQVRHHAASIQTCFDQIAKTTPQDANVSCGVAAFHVKALRNLADVVEDTFGTLPARPADNQLKFTEFGEDDSMNDQTADETANRDEKQTVAVS